MASTLIDLVPLILAAVLTPLWIIIVLLMLASPGGLAKAAAFVAGMTVTRLAQGAVFGFILSESAEAEAENGGKSPVVSTLLLVIGVLLLATAVRKWTKDVDPDDPPPKWMSSIEQIAPLKAFGLGMLLVAIGVKLWVFTLSAIAIITAADISRATSVATFLAYIVLAQGVLIAAVVGYAIAPRSAGALLQRVMAWLNRYNRPISIGATLIFGIYFTLDGARSLMN